MGAATVRTARVERTCVNARHWETDHVIAAGDTYLRHVAFPGDDGNEGGAVPFVINECRACADPTAAGPADIDPSGDCVLCATTRSAGVCCSSHGKQLCHRCYRRTHFVDICGPQCNACTAEGLPVRLSDLVTRQEATA